MPSTHVKGSRSTSGPASVPSRPSLPPRRAVSPPSEPPSPPPGTRASLRKSLPAGYSADPFRDNPSPSNSPVKTRASSYAGLVRSNTVGSNNPFRTEILTPVEAMTAPTAVRVGPPLPPRKPSLRRPGTTGPTLPPRQRARGDSLSSMRNFSDGSHEPTSITQPSNIMQQSFEAVAAGEVARRKEESVFQVIRSSSPMPPPPSKSAPPAGRRDIIDSVTKAVRESESDMVPPPPPQRTVSATRPKLASNPSSSSGAFSTAVEKYRTKYPGLRTWSAVGLFADRPHRASYAMIILNQPITRHDALLRAWAASTLRYCADGGANRLYDALDAEERAIMLPTMIKGDLDSIRPEVRAYYVSKGVAIKRDPSEYSTDLMKCIDEVESIETSSGKKFSLLLLGGLSGRLDQTVHTMSILFKMRSRRRDTFVMSEESLAWVLDAGSHLIEIDHATMGQTCGILPVGVSESFVRTEGLKWNLDWVTSLGGEVSTSNHLLPSEPAVFVETSEPVFWTVEIREGLGTPQLRSPSTADELSRGVKELGVGIARAASGVAGVGRGLGRRLSSRQGPSANGEQNKERDWERDREERERDKRERTGLVRSTSDMRIDSEDEVRYVDGGYALLD